MKLCSIQLLLILTFILTGCGGGSDNSPSQDFNQNLDVTYSSGCRANQVSNTYYRSTIATNGGYISFSVNTSEREDCRSPFTSIESKSGIITGEKVVLGNGLTADLIESSDGNEYLYLTESTLYIYRNLEGTEYLEFDRDGA